MIFIPFLFVCWVSSKNKSPNFYVWINSETDKDIPLYSDWNLLIKLKMEISTFHLPYISKITFLLFNVFSKCRSKTLTVPIMYSSWTKIWKLSNLELNIFKEFVLTLIWSYNPFVSQIHNQKKKVFTIYC